MKSKDRARAALHSWRVCLLECWCSQEKQVRKRSWYVRACVRACGRARATQTVSAAGAFVCVYGEIVPRRLWLVPFAAWNRLMEDEEEKDFMCNLKCAQEVT